MALKGSAFVIMWHDIAPEADAEYNLWHTRQHMPERLDHPGFRRSRRGINRALSRQIYFTCYEGDGLETFVSPEYLASLNGPTDWTRSVAPHFRNFLRMACTVLHTSGRGSGGGVVTSRFALPAGVDEAAMAERIRPLLHRFADHPSVTAAHLGAARPRFAGGETSETDLRPPMAEPAFALVVYLETIGLPEATALQDELAVALGELAASDQIVQSYAVAYTLERREAQ
ncbi:hypothetical protein ACFOON_02140 [Novosphingobium piscinae]|uniref:Uncharacterized protein n=1 Tax=Novosphingobium piscinae TaxID=1507448 RepID=A0A7X1FVA0_9SPHN|nr:hypothetical protein [Novosphingobium piscinae]MBC2667615.1 hypothetical protein [Novosphingobium piscinae]